MTDEMAQWSPTGVIAQAKELIHTSNYGKVAEARQCVDNTIAHWVTVVQKHQPSSPLNRQDEKTLEMELRQFKQATKVLESAVSCPVAGQSLELWVQYANFCVERKKFSNARKIFVRGVKAVKDQDKDALWQSFHAFVVAHIDPNLSLSTLKAQVLPGDAPGLTLSPPGTNTPTVVHNQANTSQVSNQGGQTHEIPSATAPPTVDADPAVQSTVHAETASIGEKHAASNTTLPIDPSLAFIDKTGQLPEAGNGITGKRSLDEADLPIKRAKHEEEQTPITNPSTTTMSIPIVDLADTKYFLHIPTTLPYIEGCPHLLFDAVGEGESKREIDNELLERLSDVLGDSAVFQGVKDLRDNQRQRDRETLHRWQDLVSMQMKEGSELFARHMDIETKHATEPRELIEVKTQHLEQRREFVSRCQMSQHQFIDICAVDRANALKAQQISLENMKIPEMTVSTDPNVISMQRAIVGLILEAEKLWREENSNTVAESIVGVVPKETTKVSSSGNVRAPAQRREAQDTAHSSHSNRSGFRGGRQVERGDMDTSGRHDYPLPSGPSHGNRGVSKRDHPDAYASPSMVATGSQAIFDRRASRHQDRMMSHNQQQQQSYFKQGHFPPPQHLHDGNQDYGNYGQTHPQDYAPGYDNPHQYIPPQQDIPRGGAGGRYVGQQAPSNAPVGWHQQQQRHPSHAAPMHDYRSSNVPQQVSSRFGGQQGPPPSQAYSSNVPPRRHSKQKGRSGGGNTIAPGPHYGSGGGGKFGGAPPPLHQQQQPQYDDYQVYDYAPPHNAPSYGANRNPVPYQQQYTGPPPFQHRGGRGGGGGGGGGFGHHPQQQQQMPPSNRRGGDRYRRAGGGGGRYGHR